MPSQNLARPSQNPVTLLSLEIPVLPLAKQTYRLESLLPILDIPLHKSRRLKDLLAFRKRMTKPSLPRWRTVMPLGRNLKKGMTRRVSFAPSLSHTTVSASVVTGRASESTQPAGSWKLWRMLLTR